MDTEPDPDQPPLLLDPAGSPASGAPPRHRSRRIAATAIAAALAVAAVTLVATRSGPHDADDAVTADSEESTTTTTVGADDPTTSTSTSADSSATTTSVEDQGPSTTGDSATTHAPTTTAGAADPPSTPTTVPPPASMTGQLFFSMADEPTSAGAVTTLGIYRMPAGGGAATEVVRGEVYANDLSTDGRWLLGEGTSIAHPIAYTRADGLGPVIEVAAGYHFPSWNPDASRIAATVSNDGRIDILDRAGNIKASYPGPSPTETHWLSADWSPDGRFLAATTGTGLYTIDLATGDYRQVMGSTLFGMSQHAAIGWSPDSKQIAYFDDAHLHLVTVATGADLELATDAAGARNPHWSRDGSAVMANLHRDGHGQLARIPLSGGPMQVLTPPDHLRFGLAI